MGIGSGSPDGVYVRRIAAALCAGLVLCAAPVRATPPPVVVPNEAENESEPNAEANGPLALLSGVSRSGVMLGDMWCLRTLLSRYGVSLGLSETSEIFGNAT